MLEYSLMKTDIRKGRGGVQVGGSATTVFSSRLDQQVRKIGQLLGGQFSGYRSGHNRRRPLFEGIALGCEPDGGMFLDADGNIMVAFEAKVQGKVGNAIERHSKNLMICKTFASSQKFRYLTFMAGAGAAQDEVLWKYAQTCLRCYNTADMREINVLHPNGVSFFLSVDGWNDADIQNIMTQALL